MIAARQTEVFSNLRFSNLTLQESYTTHTITLYSHSITSSSTLQASKTQSNFGTYFIFIVILSHIYFPNITVRLVLRTDLLGQRKS